MSPIDRSSWRPRGVAVLAAMLASLCVGPAAAAERTDVIDGFERGPDDLIGMSFSAEWDMVLRSGRILREFRCLAHDTIEGGGAELCPDGSQVLTARELTVSRATHRLNLGVELAFWRVASLRIDLPVVLFDKTDLGADDGVTSNNSTVDPYNVPSLMDVPYQGTTRTGLADPAFRVRFTPMSRARDVARPTWALDLGLVFPIAPIKKANNKAVGEGIWQLDFATGLSARPAPWVEPYFSATGTLRFAASNSLFQDLGQTQTLVSPGHGLSAVVGTEFFPYEDVEKERKLSVDVGAGIEYRFEGREYTDIFEGLGNSTCDPVDPDDPCDLTTFDRGDIDPITERRRRTDGITDVEQYALLSSWLGVHYQLLKWVKVSAMFTFAYEMPHFITFADAGRDLDGKNQVEARNSDKQNEFNPVYNDAYDALGTRFRTGGMLMYGLTLGVQGQF